MLLPFNDIQELKDTAESGLTDSCYIQDNTPSPDASGQLVDNWADRGSPTPCRFSLGGGQQVTTSEYTEAIYEISEASLIMPLGTNIGPENRVKITSLMGASIDNIIFRVEGEPLPGATGLTVRLKRVNL